MTRPTLSRVAVCLMESLFLPMMPDVGIQTSLCFLIQETFALKPWSIQKAVCLPTNTSKRRKSLNLSAALAGQILERSSLGYIFVIEPGSGVSICYFKISCVFYQFSFVIV